MQGGNKKMDQFIQYTPTEVVFGKETENQAGAEVKKWGGTKVLVVYGGGSDKTERSSGPSGSISCKRGPCL